MDAINGIATEMKVVNAMNRWIACILVLLLLGMSGAAGIAEADDLPDGGFETRQLCLENEGERIYGKAYVPEGDGPFPLVILAHGLGVTHATCVDYAVALARRGVAAYCFDFRGGADGSLSGGRVSEMSVLTEINDLEVVLEAAPGWDFVDPDRVGLMGFSQGGLVASVTAARHPEAVAALVLCYPAFIIPEMIRYQYASPEDFPESYDFGWVRVGHRYGADVYDLDPYAEIAAYEAPVLLLHGDRDNVVPMMYTTRACQVYPNPEAHIIRGAGHGFEGSQFDEAMGYVFDYLSGMGFVR